MNNSNNRHRTPANDAQVSEGNQELFVLVRPVGGGEWRIGRYIFSTTQPRG